MLGLKKLVNDRNPWVRKTVAGGLAKVYEYVAWFLVILYVTLLTYYDSSDPSSLPQLLPLMQTLLASPSPLTLGATLTAFSEICPDRLDLLHPYYRHICHLLVDADEWGQAVALGILTRYARTMLERPHEPSASKSRQKSTGNEEDDDDFIGLDRDLAMLLDCARPLFQSRNPAVVLATARLFYYLAPLGHGIVGRELLVSPLLRLAGDGEGEEVKALTWEVIANMVEEQPVRL
jgi:AP-3 complex subunit beta